VSNTQSKTDSGITSRASGLVQIAEPIVDEPISTGMTGWSCEPRNHIKSLDGGEGNVLPIKVSTKRSSEEVWKTW